MHHLNYQTKSQPELILNLMQHGLVKKGVNIGDSLLIQTTHGML